MSEGQSFRPMKKSCPQGLLDILNHHSDLDRQHWLQRLKSYQLTLQPLLPTPLPFGRVHPIPFPATFCLTGVTLELQARHLLLGFECSERTTRRTRGVRRAVCCSRCRRAPMAAGWSCGNRARPRAG